MPRTTPIRILLIDDHQLFNNGLKLLLDEQVDFEVCGQVFQANEVLPAIRIQQPDLVLLDVNIQGVNGIDLGKKILSYFNDLKVLILTMYNQPKLLDETRKAGLHGYLLKDATTPELLTGIRAVLNGSKYFDSRVAAMLVPEADPFGDDFVRRLNLTFREVEIIRLIREGLTSDQIADRLNISVFTIGTHRKNIYFKLGVNNVVELVQFATRHGI